MTYKIAFICQKGGVGKTTLSVNTALSFAKSGRKTLLIDCDKQKSAVRFLTEKVKNDEKEIENLKFLTLDEACADIKRLPELASSSSYDVIIFDTPPAADNSLLRAVIAACNHGIVISPVRPSALDLWALEDTLSLMNAAQKQLDIKYRILLTNVKNRAAITSDIISIMNELKLPGLRAVVCDRTGYARSFSELQSIYDDPKYAKLANEIGVLRDVIIKTIDSKKGEK